MRSFATEHAPSATTSSATTSSATTSSATTSSATTSSARIKKKRWMRLQRSFGKEISSQKLSQYFKEEKVARTSISNWVNFATEALSENAHNEKFHAQKDKESRFFELLILTSLVPQTYSTCFSDSFKSKFTMWNNEKKYMVPGSCFSSVNFTYWVLFRIGVQFETRREIAWILTLFAQSFGFAWCVIFFVMAKKIKTPPKYARVDDNILSIALKNAAFLQGMWPKGQNPSDSSLLHSFQRVLLLQE